jgi:hypothetical protein
LQDSFLLQIKMKKIHRLFATLLLASLCCLGCNSDCKDVSCVNGECSKGECLCTTGYEGLDCATALNAKFSGNYRASETCTGAAVRTYGVTVVPQAGASTVVAFTGLWGQAGKTANAVVTLSGTAFLIQRQAISGTSYDLEAPSGTITADGKTIDLAYNIYWSDSTLLTACTAVLERQ